VFHLALVELIGAVLLASGSWVRPCAALAFVDLGVAGLLSASPSAGLAAAVALASALLGAGAWALRLEDSRPGDGGPYWDTWS
jgi:uncharacterized membrane protein YphA (DoxX/SURF4 family)